VVQKDEFHSGYLGAEGTRTKMRKRDEKANEKQVGTSILLTGSLSHAQCTHCTSTQYRTPPSPGIDQAPGSEPFPNLSRVGVQYLYSIYTSNVVETKIPTTHMKERKRKTSCRASEKEDFEKTGDTHRQ